MSDQEQSTAGAPDLESALAAVAALGLAADQSALLRGALRSGFLARCAEPVTVAELARATGLLDTRVEDLCTALRALGALGIDDRGRFTVAAAYRSLLGGGEQHALDRLESSVVRQRAIEDLFTQPRDGWYWRLDAADRRHVAAGVTVDPTTDLARTAIGAMIDNIAEVREAFAGGARYLELGCGLAGALLTYLQLYPEVTAVGLELAEDLLKVARERAAVLGVGDRVEFVAGDAGAYTDSVPFDVAFWSQFFFTRDSRRAALANAFARLRPGGLLLAPVLFTGADDAAATDPEIALDVLLVRSWGVPALSADGLVAEIGTAGFQHTRIVPGPFATVVVARRP